MESTKIIVQPNPNKKPLALVDLIIPIDGEEEERRRITDLTRNPNTVYMIKALMSASRKVYNTGLDIMVDNPYADEAYISDPEFKRIFHGAGEQPSPAKVKLQHVVEYKFGKPLNYYTSVPSRGDQSKTFWETQEATWFLPDGKLVLDLAKENDFLLYHVLLASKYVANSLTEMNNQHEYVIYKEIESEQIRVGRERKLDKAIAKLTKLEEEYENAILDFCKVLDIRGARTMTKDFAYTALKDFVGNNSLNIDKFNEIYKLFANELPEKRAQFYARVKIYDYIELSRIIVKSGNEYKWVSPNSDTENRSWDRYPDLVKFMLDPRYQAEQEAMAEQHERKMAFF